MWSKKKKIIVGCVVAFFAIGIFYPDNKTEAPVVSVAETVEVTTVAETVPVPTTVSVEEIAKQEMKTNFKTVAADMVASSDGIILALAEDHNEEGYFNMRVANAWYLSSLEEKQYFAEEMLKSITAVSKQIYGADQYVNFYIFDESDNIVAKNKISGGMKIE